MDSKELRIGNIVGAATDEKGDNIACKIIELLGNYCNWTSDLTDPVVGGSSSTSYPFIVGLPLTEQWIRKMGFAEKDLGDEPPYYIFEHKINKGFDIWNFNGEHWILDMADQNLISQDHFKYVHQLQNLYFALTGEELQVNQ